jgi:hypothetical protein
VFCNLLVFNDLQIWHKVCFANAQLFIKCKLHAEEKDQQTTKAGGIQIDN